MKIVNTSLLLTVFLICAILNVGANSGELKGRVISKTTGEDIPFCNVVLTLNDSLILGATTDFEGKYRISGILPGEYDVSVSTVGFTSQKITEVTIKNGKTTFLDFKLSEESIQLDAVQVISYKVPLMDKDNTTLGQQIIKGEIYTMPSRSSYGVASTVGGVYSLDGSIDLNSRGSRRDANVFYIDGVRVRGVNNVPKAAIEEVTIVTDAITDVFEEGIITYNEEPNTEEYDPIQESPFKKVTQEPLSTLSIDVDNASYGNVRRFLNQNQMPPKDAVRIEEMINYFSYEYDLPNDEHPFTLTSEVGKCPWNKKHKLLHVGVQGKTLKAQELKRSNLVFLLDVSGSMDSPERLPLVKKSMKLLLDSLKPNDRVAIVVYAGSAGLVLPSTTVRNKEEILKAIAKLHAAGSTSGSAGIKLAYKEAAKNLIPNGNNRVILCTDGDFNMGLTSNEALVKLIEEKREEEVFLTICGFGMGNYKDAKMEQISNAGNGNYFYIDNILEAKKVFATELRANMFTIAKDVKIQIEFNPGSIQAYRLIGYENRMLNKEDFNDDQKDAGELGAGHTVTALYEIVPLTEKTPDDVLKVDDLRYQVLRNNNDSLNGELCLVKMRYKPPKEDESILIQKTVNSKDSEVSENFQFSAAVASFGMLLRESSFVQELNFPDVLALAKKGKGEDQYGYRAEFISLVEKAELLSAK